MEHKSQCDYKKYEFEEDGYELTEFISELVFI